MRVCNCESEISSIKKALRILVNTKGLDLTIDPSCGQYGLRFYTTFSRHDALYEMPVLTAKNSAISLLANISVPNGYEALFDNTERNELITLHDLKAVAFIIKEEYVDMLLAKLASSYPCSLTLDPGLNSSLITELVCNGGMEAVYEFGVPAIDRSFNTIRGTIAAYDSNVVWIKSVDGDGLPTFFIIPIGEIAYVLQQKYLV